MKDLIKIVKSYNKEFNLNIDSFDVFEILKSVFFSLIDSNYKLKKEIFLIYCAIVDSSIAPGRKEFRESFFGLEFEKIQAEKKGAAQNDR